MGKDICSECNRPAVFSTVITTTAGKEAVRLCEPHGRERQQKVGYEKVTLYPIGWERSPNTINED